MTLLGLVAMMDPPRAEARDAVQVCEAAGIRAVMITGDHPLTASTIAGELGMLKDWRVVTGRELEAMSDDDLERDVADIAVYARVSPADKLRVVTAWQSRGQVVAMTGDGVNDAPALKKADVGIAMGIAGTDVSKEAAGMTLLDDNFATIVAAVEEGRIVFGNIKKYLMYLLSCNVGEIVLLAGAVIAGLPMPLTAVQILYVNLATDGLPALALAVDPPEPDLMRRQPARPARRHLHATGRDRCCSTAGLWSALVNITLFTWLLRAGRPLERGHGDDVRDARADPVLQRLQLPFRSALDRSGSRSRTAGSTWPSRGSWCCSSSSSTCRSSSGRSGLSACRPPTGC